MDNPFFFGRTVASAAFINRHREIHDIAANLSRGQSLILFSPRRYGKTSLIKRAIEQMKKQGILVFYFDLYRMTTLDQFCTCYSQGIISAIRSPMQKAFDLIRSLLPSLKPRLVFSEPGGPSVEVEASLETLRRSATLKELFDSIETYCVRNKKRGCVVFDEFQEITAIAEGNIIEREMRAAFQHHSAVAYAFLGSQYHLMHDLFADKNRPFYHFGAHYELDVIAEDEWVPFIRDNFVRGQKSMSEEVCRGLAGITRGHPYYTQLLCSTLWDQTVKERVITASMVQKALSTALEKEGHAFHELWDSLKPDERTLISAIAREENVPEIFSAAFSGRHHLGAASSIQRTVSRLVKRGLLIRKKGSYPVTDPLFLRWIVTD